MFPISVAENNLTIYSKTLLIIFFLFTHGIHLVPWWLQFLFVSNLIKGSFWCASWTAWPVRPTYAFLSRSRPDRQTAAALLTRLTQHTNHATCCRGSWSTLTKVILHTVYFMQKLVHACMHKARHCRTDAPARAHYQWPFSNSLYCE